MRSPLGLLRRFRAFSPVAASVTALAVLLIPSPGFALVVDDFEQGQFAIEDGPGGESATLVQTGLVAPGSLSGRRSWVVRHNSAPTAGFARLSLAPDAPDALDDAVVLSVDPNVSAHADVTLFDVLPGDAYDLRAMGDAVRVVIAQAPVFGDVHVGFTDAQGRQRGRAINVSQPGERFWAMPETDANFDYHAVTKLVLSFNVIGSATPRDYHISDISVVPEPCGPAFAMAGGAFALARGRRRCPHGRR